MSRAKQQPDDAPRTSKVRSDMVLHGLPEERQEEIIRRINASSAEAVARELRAESPPVIISARGVRRFAAFWRARQSFSEAMGYREAVLVQLEESYPHMDLERLEKWGDVMFLQTALGEKNLEGYTRLRAVMERAKQTQLDAKRLAMLEAKEKKLEAVEAAMKAKRADGGLSPETLEMMEEMLGMMS